MSAPDSATDKPSPAASALAKQNMNTFYLGSYECRLDVCQLPADQQEGEGLIEDHEFLECPHIRDGYCVLGLDSDSCHKTNDGVTCQAPASRHRGTKVGR